MACRLRGATERLEPDPACRDALNHSPSDQEASQGLCAKPSLAGRKEKALCRASALRPYTVASATSVFVCRPVLAQLGHHVLLSSWPDVDIREIQAHVALHLPPLQATSAR